MNHSTHPSSRLPSPAMLVLAAAAVALGPAGLAKAGNYSWLGNNDFGIPVWTDARNWSGGVVPPSDLLNTNIRFGEFASANFLSVSQLNVPYSIRSINFERIPLPFALYELRGGPLTIGAGGLRVVNNANEIRFTAAVVLGADQTWNLATPAGKAIEFDGGISLSGGPGNAARALTVFADPISTVGTRMEGNIAGAGSLTTTGEGMVILNGASTYTGGTTLAAGTLRLDSAGAIGSTGAVNFAGGTLRYTAANTTDYSPRFSNAVNRQYNIDTNGQSVTFASPLTSSGGKLNKIGAGTLTLTAANTYTGGTTLTGGHLRPGHSGAFGNAGQIQFAGGTLLYGGGTTQDFSSRFSTAAGQTYSVDTAGASVTFASGLTSSGGGLNKFGAGTLTLAGANTYSGITTVVGGTLAVSNAMAGEVHVGPGAQFSILNGANANLQFDGTSLIVSGNATTPATLNISGGNLTSTVAFFGDEGKAEVIQTGGTYSSGNFGIILGNRDGGDGTYTLSGGVLRVNRVIGGPSQSKFNFNGGTLTASGDSPIFVQGVDTANVQAGGARFDSNGFSVTAPQLLVHDTTPGAPATDGGLTKLGAGTLTLPAANTYTGATVVRAGTLNLTGNRTAVSGPISVADSTTDATLNLSGGTYTINGTFAVGIGSTGTVNQTAGAYALTGTQLIVGNGTASGVYNMSGGTLTGAASSTRGVILGVNSGATGTFNLSGGTLNLGTSNLQVGRSENAPVTGATGVFNQTGGTATVGHLGIAGAVGASNAGNIGTLNLTGGTFAATTFAALAGGDNSTATIRIGGTSQVTLPAFPTARGTNATATVTFDGGTLTPAAASTAYMGGLTNAFLTANGAKFNTPAGRDITITQPLSNATAQTGTLTKLGGGTLTLTGVSTYTGATTITAGTLVASNVTGSATGSGAVAVNAGGTLAGSGAVGGPLFVNTGGTLAPGNSLGRLTLGGDLTLAGGSTLVAELAGTVAGSQHDQVVVVGAVTLGGTLTVALLDGYVPLLGDTFFLLDLTGDAPAAGAFDNVTPLTATTGLLTVDDTMFLVNYADRNPLGVSLVANDLSITAVVPEPTSLLWAATFAGLLARRRR